MKKIFFIIVVLFIFFEALSQTKPVKIIFDITSKDTIAHQTVLRHVSGMAAAYPGSEFEVVVYGSAITMLVKDKSTVKEGMSALATNKNVSFKVCSATMKRYDVDKSQLLPGVVIVPDAIMEIVTKQGQGWGYIKE
ncbi:MAG: hypothetical protein C0490_25005 [Marivirga sp.]|nr:hypothetical protein [Marivirga sp.]